MRICKFVIYGNGREIVTVLADYPRLIFEPPDNKPKGVVMEEVEINGRDILKISHNGIPILLISEDVLEERKEARYERNEN